MWCSGVFYHFWIKLCYSKSKSKKNEYLTNQIFLRNNIYFYQNFIELTIIFECWYMIDATTKIFEVLDRGRI